MDSELHVQTSEGEGVIVFSYLLEFDYHNRMWVQNLARKIKIRFPLRQSGKKRRNEMQKTERPSLQAMWKKNKQKDVAAENCGTFNDSL